MKFRKDINGLRAIAVLAVVLFHFFPNILPGGFAGVDVFFVISGYLMTSIILSKISTTSFNLLSFYVDRANRIMPALAVVSVFLLVLGWFFLTPPDYKDLGKHAGGSLTFISNILYAGESGYFATSAYDKLFLHSWSLSVEWQFYLVYPLVLLGLKKVLNSEIHFKICILLLLIILLCVSVGISYYSPDKSYFLLESRAWEMLAGSLAFLYSFKFSKHQALSLEVLGVSLIVFSYFLFDKNDIWPGYSALVPVLGTLCVIFSSSNSVLTNNTLFQFFGKISYSLYLWHWPVAAFLYQISVDDIGITSVALVGVVVISYFSYKYIESIKFKKLSSGFYGLFKVKPLYFSLSVFAFCCIVFIGGGFKDRFSITDTQSQVLSDLVMPSRANGYCFNDFEHEGSSFEDVNYKTCLLGSQTNHKSNTLLFGDSFAGHYDPLVDMIFNHTSMSYNSVSTNWCLPSLGDKFFGPYSHTAYQQCLKNRSYLKENVDDYDNIIFAGFWERGISNDQFDDVVDAILFAAQNGRKVFLIAQPVVFDKNPLTDFYRSLYFDTPFNIADVKTKDELGLIANAKLESLAQKYDNIFFISREMLFKGQNSFKYNGIEVPYSLDGKHISLLASKSLYQNLLSSQEAKNIISEFDI